MACNSLDRDLATGLVRPDYAEIKRATDRINDPSISEIRRAASRDEQNVTLSLTRNVITSVYDVLDGDRLSFEISVRTGKHKVAKLNRKSV